jgi:pteridine reductase
MNHKSVLITGGAHRIGAAICHTLHKSGFTVYMHYGQSCDAAKKLQRQLNTIRADSCFIFSADLAHPAATQKISEWLLSHTQQLSLLVNNASCFDATPWEKATPQQWQKLLSINTQSPFFLSQSLLPALKKANGQVINLIDIHVERGLHNHPIYCASKAALKSLTLSLAKDMKGEIRCNGISPGAILWPDHDANTQVQQEILQKIPMGHLGDVDNIAQTVRFLVDNEYVNGQIINVDGGRTLHS